MPWRTSPAHKERCVSYAALMDAAAATPGVVQQWGRTSPYAHLLQSSSGMHLELYRSSALDDTGAPLRTVVAVHLEHMGGMVAAKLCSLATPRAVGAFLAELRRLKRLNGRWGLSFDRWRRCGATIFELFDGGDFAGLLDRAVVQAWQCGERIRPHLLLRPLADVGQEVYEFNSCERHAWMDGKSSNVALRQQGPAGMIDVGSALPHGPARREHIVDGCDNHDAFTIIERQVTPQSDVGSLGIMTLDALLGRPASSAGAMAGAVGYKHTTAIFRMIRDFISEHSCEELLALEMPVSNLLGVEPSLAGVGLLLSALLICPDNTVKLTVEEAVCGLRGLARAQEVLDTRQDGPGGFPYLAYFHLLLAQLCAFIGQRRLGLPDSPSVSRGGAAVLGEAGLAVARELYTSSIVSFNTAIRSAAPYWTHQGTITAEAWELCTQGLHLEDNQLPRVYHPVLHPAQFGAMFAFEERDRRHWLTENILSNICEDFPAYLLYKGMCGPAPNDNPSLLVEPLQQWLYSLLAPTVECAEAHAGRLQPPAAIPTRTSGSVGAGAAEEEEEVPRAAPSPALAGSNSHNQRRPPKSFTAQLAELQAECAIKGIAEGSPEYNDAVIDLLANLQQLLHLGTAAPQRRSGRGGGSSRSTAALTSAPVAWQGWTKTVESCCTALGLSKLPKGAAAAVQPSSILLYFACGHHGVVQAARTLQAMPPWIAPLLGHKVYIVADVYSSALSMQQEVAGSGCSAAALAQLPHLPPDQTRAAGLQFVLTLQGNGSMAGSSKGSSKPAATKQAAGHAGRGAAGQHAAAAQDAENSIVQPWLAVAAELIASGGVVRGPVSLTCEWGPLWSLLREQGIGACPQLSAAWQVLALRSLASLARVQRHLKLYLCVQNPTAAGTQFVPLPTRFQPRDYTDSKLAAQL
ncbi:putative leucine-rich repeat receptor kinase [Chlorella sorokiniana]|uniref:Leucine-rich repeat receptor kinase n=1 Tax=Chlorella sorokiniana TaxID=3076 RepID=A0A2P6U284_CHLSO|nr:putative leucine-rich repeat receptor kinase [Chlorella sorokiniana]|eukprot:PRW60428.1 putative leucine-rich repeat receptor kinase [Chlorella sorokiniana]